MMKEIIGVPATYENLAEECAELAKAALKMARFLRKENPLGFEYTEDEIHNELIEEYTDVCLNAQDLGLAPDGEIGKNKLERFLERVTHKEDPVEHLEGEVV